MFYAVFRAARLTGEAQTKQQAEAAERHLIQEMFSKRYGGENNTSFRDFASDRYLRYVGQKNVNIGAKRLYVGILVRSFGAKLLADITPQDCRKYQVALNAGREGK